ncbi:MAG TPA: prepilin-type N-terminal cleavage/methylation domain-containing protein [Candidatus Hydrogenedentes bacterium]|nr:prepilin-type N-terminal cleavage/methylation domain-containing protein [Candidatus Hydrogenedentota bacterium]HOJ69930.1 prepilin-type N-terminal cleavage/methylation domain-containing protein [Candidatus Hydrogenedentota bacterium]HOK89632.1 prepilin-type N-terminal cleavage/methylation domain-containing protein [Candidatus Hydrogenedentota bacterium]
MDNRVQGFTLIELIIVVAIIALIAAIAIPNLIRSRLEANEASAIQNLRAIISAEGAYHAQNNRYTTDFADLVNANPPFINGDWVPAKNGYLFTLGGTDVNYTVNANPETFNVTGTRGFYCDSTGVIRVEIGQPADENSTPLSDR